MSASFNPYVQGWRVGHGPSGDEQPSSFGTLPGSSGNALAARGGVCGGCVIVHITYFRSNVLNASDVDACCRQYYRIVTDAPQQLQRAVYFDNRRHTVVLIDWTGVRPIVEIPRLLPRQALRSWLHSRPDHAYVCLPQQHRPICLWHLPIPSQLSRSRILENRGISHILVPDGEYICVCFTLSVLAYAVGLTAYIA